MVAEQVIQVIEGIAQQLGVAVEKVYPMLVAQSKVFCGTYHVTLGVCVVALVLLVVGIVGYHIADNKYSEVGLIISIFCIIISIVAFVVGAINALCGLTDYMTALHNPDWWAIEYVAKLLT